MSHVTHMDESRRTYKWVSSHIWMSYVSHVNESSFTQARRWSRRKLSLKNYRSLLEKSHIKETTFYTRTYILMKSAKALGINESCHTYEWVMSHVWTSRTWHRCVDEVGDTSYYDKRWLDEHNRGCDWYTLLLSITDANILMVSFGKEP